MPNAGRQLSRDPSRPPSTPGSGGGQDGRTEARPARALDDESLRALYFDLLGRPPFEDERGRWIGAARHVLLDELLGSEHFWNHWWEGQLYYFLLIDNFRPATDTARQVPTKLTEKRLSVRDALRLVAMTPTFDLRNPGADTFVTVVMEQFVGMKVQSSARELEIGKGAYDGREGRFLGQLAGNQSDVVRIAVEHKNATRYFLGREYERYVRSAPEKKSLIGWTRKQHTDPYEYLALVREWLMSTEYDQRLGSRHPKTNQLFVRGMFVDLLGRLPTHDEVEPMRNALDGLSDSRPLRSVLVRLLLDSGDVPIPSRKEIEDPTAWIGDLFRRLLGREAAPDELSAFVKTFHDPACRPATILYALLSSAEYQAY